MSRARVAVLPEPEWTMAVTETVKAFGRLNIVTTLARHPRLAAACSSLGGMLLFEGELPSLYRELVILRTACRTGCGYLREHHVALGLAAGLSGAEIAALSAELGDFPWSAADLPVLQAVDELLDTCAVSDQVWGTLAGQLGEVHLIELVVLTGYYRLIAMTVNSLRIPLEDSAHE
jgi:4-carboxymuconolactone decarboxylase